MARINDITPQQWNSLNWEKKATDKQVGGVHYLKTNPAKFIQGLNLSWCRSNAIKYILRAGNKGPDIREDIEKAIHYLELELEINEGDKNIEFNKFTRKRFEEYSKCEDQEAELDYSQYVQSNLEDLKNEFTSLHG